MSIPTKHPIKSSYDYCVIGAGIVGLAVALEILKRDHGATLIVVEKEKSASCHQTGHNSGVIHAGIYYQPGSLKAQLCRQGAIATKEFCISHNISFEECGKLLVATSLLEAERMEALSGRAVENEIDFEHISTSRLQQIEPTIKGLGALLVPSTGIVNYTDICNAMIVDIQDYGGNIVFDSTVKAIHEHDHDVEIIAGDISICCKRLIACAGLQSDRLATLAGLKINHHIIPFRGEYYTLPSAHSKIVNHLIYPIPDPDLPFLGVHLTRMIDGSITVGPNAVLGFAREGYPKGSMNLHDIGDMISFGGFWRMVKNNWHSGMDEFKSSIFKSNYLEKCRKYCPSLTLSDLTNSKAGIRAQAVLHDGTLVHDFLFVESERMLHICNAPSPAATSAIPIATMIVDRFFNSSSDLKGKL